ncbi:hypothetical protein H0B56_14515 [Haloechinothrix sp. YIM 98757]|uniref:Uncharacterized protein n=1 Tax=Haloechinothrix aidingensis TaxID=2752311 RepID=A0A838ABY8_9PSEU|nr:hypothetical protein [Haloechinothrix aidingensis]MBA0126760.1 hypothetical protein [Haloechinothrix aidingensis]
MRSNAVGNASTPSDGAAGQTVWLPVETTTAVLITRQARQRLDLDREIKDTGPLIRDRFRTHP